MTDRPRRLTAREWQLAGGCFVMGAAAAVFFIWPELFSNAWYITDVRQQPNWLAYHGSPYRADDLLVRYSQYNESPIQNAIYYLGTFLFDGVTVGKIVTVVSYGCCSTLCFVLCASLYGWRAGLLAALYFCFFTGQIEFFSSGFSRAWIVPLLLLWVYILQIERYVWLTLLLPFAALAYPPAPVLMGLVGMVHLALTARHGKSAFLSLAKALAVAAAAALLVLLPKYASPPDWVGPLVPGHLLRQMPEMYRGGLAPYLPTPPLLAALTHWGVRPLTCVSVAACLLVLGPGKLEWPRAWTSLLVGSMLGYLLADLLFLRLYIPNRYLRHSLPLLTLLWSARHWALIWERLPRRSTRVWMLAGLLTTGVYLHRSELKPGLWSMNRTRFEGVCGYLRTLPTEVLIAGHPRAVDDIAIQGRRSVLVNYKQAHPWFPAYYATLKKRTEAALRAMYAADPEPINALHRRYGVTHFLVDRHYLRRGQPYRNPYNRLLKQLYAAGEPFYLSNPPRQAVVYDDGRYLLLKLPLPDGTPAGSVAPSRPTDTSRAHTAN